jgi:hypothetical protein
VEVFDRLVEGDTLEGNFDFVFDVMVVFSGLSFLHGRDSHLRPLCEIFEQGTDILLAPLVLDAALYARKPRLDLGVFAFEANHSLELNSGDLDPIVGAAYHVEQRVDDAQRKQCDQKHGSGNREEDPFSRGQARPLGADSLKKLGHISSSV